MEILWLDGGVVAELLTMADAMEAVEGAFREHGLRRVQMPPKLYLDFPKYGGDLRIMPAYIEALDMAGVKVVNVHPRNPPRLPTVMATLVLNDPRTGAPVALLDATNITDMRTGAAGGVAVRHLARKDARVLGLVGAGRQARTQLLAIKEVRKLELVRVASKSLEESRAFKAAMKPLVGCEIVPEAEVRDACRCDILVTVTPARAPIVKSEWVEEGTHINAIGADAPGKEELDPEILRRAKVVVDDLAQASHSGEVNVPLAAGLMKQAEIHAELGEIVTGTKRGREGDREITIFDSTGLAVQDVAVGAMIYRRAGERGMGTKLKFLLP